MSNQKSSIQIKKKNFFLTTTIILAVAIISIFLLPTFNKNTQVDIDDVEPSEEIPVEKKIVESNPEGVKEFKKVLFESISCRYSCPLIEADIEGTPALVADPECTESCSKEIIAKDYHGDNYLEEELVSDELLRDIERGLASCRISSSLNKETNTENVRNFYNCATEKLNEIKEGYDYLN